jgi:glycosyltransferase involved in cell wall biosynthesis
MRLSGKIIFILSYENWGRMLMSKHHYAIELGRAGNKVYFINHPDKRKELRRGEVRVTSTESENVSVVQHRLWHPYVLKFRAKWVYNIFTSFHIKKILRAVEDKPDVVWSFDTGNTLPLKFFPASAIKIYMPVDGPFGHEDERRSAEESDVIVSVTDRILNAYDVFDKPKFRINHGVAEVFLNAAAGDYDKDQLKVGYSGSLIRNDLDTECFITIIKRHPQITFEFWGEYDYNKSNIHLPQDVLEDTHRFLDTLKSLPNVVLHGPVNSAKLAEGLRRMDILLICYKIKNDQNHHKVLEYLGTGKVIVSNFMTSYEKEDHDLIYMVKNSESNYELPDLFDTIVRDLDYYNSEVFKEKRRRFASKYSYSNNIKRIEEFISAR